MHISIAMATYNGGKYLQEQLNSFVEQTKKPDELVVCDDGSTDETLDILRQFQLTAPFSVNIYQNNINLGFKKNFEKTLSLCKGNLIFLSDQDDRWFPNKIEKMTSALKRSKNVHVLVADMVICDGTMTPSQCTQLGNHLAIGIGSENYGPGCATLIRKEFLELLLPIPSEVSGHDGWIHKVANALNVRGIIEEPVQYYRRHDVNSSNSISSTTTRPTSIAVLRAYGLDNAVNGWHAAVLANKCISRRLAESVSVLASLGLTVNAMHGQAIIKSKIERIVKRTNLVKVNRLIRTLFVMKFWLEGGYSEFSGWRSAVKDVVRRT